MKRLPVTLMLLLAAFLALAPTARAQFGGLPDNVIDGTNLDLKLIEDHIAKHLPLVQGGEAEAVKKARNELVGFALSGKTIGVNFRQAYSGKLIEHKLADLLSSDKDIVAVNALRIAGDVATTGMVDLIEPYLTHERQAVRYAAVAAFGRTFEQAAAPASSPGVTADRMVAMIGKVAALYGTEKDQLVADALARALVSACNIDKQKFESVRPAAVSKLADAVGVRLKKFELRPEDSQLLDTTIRVGTLLSDLLGGAQGANLAASAQKDAAGFGGDLVAWVVRQINNSKLSSAEKEQRTVAGALLSAGEKIIFYAAKSQNVAGVQETNLKGLFDKNDKFGDAEVANKAVQSLIGESGVLCKAPFNFKADRYSTK